MVKLRIKNFGPIKEIYKDEYLIINKVSVFIGEQGSGKSTIAKLFSTLSWLEKDFFRTPQNASNFGSEEFIQYCANQKLSDYFIDEKIPSSERDAILLLATDDRVLWVVGHRFFAPKGQENLIVNISVKS